MQPSALPSSTGSLAMYLAEINKYPLLTVDEEQRLARLYAKSGDLDAAHHRQAPKLSGKIAKIVTPKRVPAAKLMSAQSGLCSRRSDALIEPPARAKM